MRRFLTVLATAGIIALTSALIFSLPSRGQLGMTGIGAGGFGGAASSYTGPGDIVSGATFWLSCARAYNAAYAASGTGGACDVVDSSTGLVTCTFHIKTTGLVDPTECTGTACAVACKVTKAYDQTGNGNHGSQGTLGQMPTLNLTFAATRPCMTFARASTQFLATPSINSINQPWSVSVVAERTGTTTNYNGILGNSATLYFDTTANNVLLFAGSTSFIAAANDSALHAIQGVFNGASSNLKIDSAAAATGNPGAGNIGTASVDVGGAGGGGSSLDGAICEAGLWNGATFSAGNMTSIYTNQNTYAGAP